MGDPYIEQTEAPSPETLRRKLRVITGGKGPPEEPTENWLGDMSPGTSFVARERNSKNVDFNLYHVVFKREGVMLLKWELPDGKLLDYYVDPKRFSSRFVDPVILGIVNLEEALQAPKEVEDEQRNRTDPS